LLYDHSPQALAIFSVAAQLAALPFLYITHKRWKSVKAGS